jgi:hypothetical protein
VAIGDMPKVASVLAPYGLPTVLVNLADAKDEVLPFYQTRGLAFPVIYDTTSATQERWGVTSVPTVLLLDANAQVAYRGNAVWRNLAGAAECTLKLPAGKINFVAAGTGFG